MGTACLHPHQTRPSPCAMGRNLATNLDQTARVLVPAPRELLPTGHARSRRGAPTQGSATPDAVAPAHAVTPWVVRTRGEVGPLPQPPPHPVIPGCGGSAVNGFGSGQCSVCGTVSGVEPAMLVSGCRPGAPPPATGRPPVGTYMARLKVEPVGA